MNFCRRCGAPLKQAQGQEYTCSAGHSLHANPLPGVGVFFISPDNTKVLLSTRGIEPRKGMLDAFGGFLEMGEDFEEAAIRELHEELGLKADDYEPLTYLTGGHDTYPYKGEPLQYVSILFWTKLKTKVVPHAADDVASADWYQLSSVRSEQLQANDIRKGVHKLQELFNQEEHT